MQCIKEEKIKRVIEGDNIDIKGVIINGLEYYLEVVNKGGNLSLNFYNPRITERQGSDYEINIGKGGVSFQRMRWRPSHDHDDTEYLQRKKETSNEPYWDSLCPGNPLSGTDIYKIPFGSVRSKSEI